MYSINLTISLDVVYFYVVAQIFKHGDVNIAHYLLLIVDEPRHIRYGNSDCPGGLFLFFYITASSTIINLFALMR